MQFCLYFDFKRYTYRNVVQIKQTKFRFVYFLFGYLFSFKIARLILDVSATLCSCVVITFTERTSWEVFIVVDYGKKDAIIFNETVDGVPVSDEEKDGYAWLKERENPEDLVLLGAPYDGPKITET